MTFNKLLGIRVVRRHEDGLTIELPLKPEFLNNAGLIHGGVTATVADSALGIALWDHFGGKRNLTTVEMKVSYLRPAVEGKITARARIIRAGKNICVGSVDLFDGEGRQIAVALLTYMLLPASAGEAPSPDPAE